MYFDVKPSYVSAMASGLAVVCLALGLAASALTMARGYAEGQHAYGQQVAALVSGRGAGS